VINGGEGTDTLTTSAAIAAAAAATISNVEIIGFSGTAAQDMTAFLNAGTTTLAATGGAGTTLTVTNAQAALNTIVFGAGGTYGTTSLSLTRLVDSTTSDALGVYFADGIVATTLVTPSLANEETLTIGESGTDSTAAITVALGTVTATSLKTLNITGSNNHTMTLSGNTTLATINASAATGTLNITDGNSAVNETITGPASTAMTVTGGSGNDSITGGAAADSMVGGAGADTITGGAGADTISGGLGIDSLVGGDGSDTVSLGAVGVTDGGSSVNTGFVVNLSSSAITAATIAAQMPATNVVNSDTSTVASNTVTHLGATTATVSSRVDTLSSFENVIDSTGNDYIVGSSSANTITTLGGTDYISAGSGDDTIVMSSFLTTADTIVGGAGTDTLTITDDTTTTDLANVSTVEVYTIAMTSASSYTHADTQVASGATLTINQSGAFALTYNGAAETNGTLVINAAGAGAHVITGGSLADTITTSTVGSTITGGLGIDAITLGAAGGVDTIVLTTGGAIAVDTVSGFIVALGEDELQIDLSDINALVGTLQLADASAVAAVGATNTLIVTAIASAGADFGAAASSLVTITGATAYTTATLEAAIEAGGVSGGLTAGDALLIAYDDTVNTYIAYMTAGATTLDGAVLSNVTITNIIQLTGVANAETLLTTSFAIVT